MRTGLDFVAGGVVYCEACRSTHSSDCKLIEEYCAYRKTYEGLCPTAGSVLRGDLSNFARFVLARGRSLREVDNEDIEAYLNFWRSQGGRVGVVSSRNFKVRSFYRWLQKTGVIKRAPALIQQQLSFSWDLPTT